MPKTEFWKLAILTTERICLIRRRVEELNQKSSDKWFKKCYPELCIKVVLCSDHQNINTKKLAISNHYLHQLYTNFSSGQYTEYLHRTLVIALYKFIGKTISMLFSIQNGDACMYTILFRTDTGTVMWTQLYRHACRIKPQLSDGEYCWYNIFICTSSQAGLMESVWSCLRFRASIKLKGYGVRSSFSLGLHSDTETERAPVRLCRMNKQGS